MSEKRKSYLYDPEVPLTKYKQIELRKRLIEIEEQQIPLPAQLEQPIPDNRQTDSDDINLVEAGFSNLLQHQAVEEVDTERTVFNEPKNNEYWNSHLTNQNGETNNFSYEELYSSNEDLVIDTDIELHLSKSTEILQEKSFFESISLNISICPAYLLLMSLKFAISSRLSLTALANLLQFANLICGKNVLPETRYTINKICGTVKNVTFHSICPGCTKYMGTFEGLTEPKVCENCNSFVNVSNVSDPCFFATIDPSEDICDILKTHEEYYDYVMNERQHEQNHIKDIYDGELYRRFVRNLGESDRYSYATVIFSTDGAPVFKSSKFSMWPVYIIINEIPPQSRMNSAITVGLWCGNSKPEMSVILDIFVNMMNHLSSIGINCTIKNSNRCIKVYALLACVDTQARPAMNGSSHFNARYGCDWCLHEGKYFAGTMRYPYLLPLPIERDHESTIKYATDAVESGTRVFGIVSASPLLNLQKFDIVEGFTPDYMHCCLAGVVKQFTDYIVGHLTKTDIDYINILLKKIRAPNQIGRLSRSLEHKNFWKAREFENWALYYSVPILSSVITKNMIIKHWCLLVDALHICLKMDITFNELNRINVMLHEFVKQAKDIYSLSALTYNVHQLLHLVKSIYNWGPLFAHSTFPFEAANHNLLTAIHCAKGVILQIVKYDGIQRCIRNLENKLYKICPNEVIDYCEHVGSPLAKFFYKISNITYLGKEKIIKDVYVNKFNICKRTKMFNKIVFNGCLYMTSHKQNERSCNYFARLDDKRFVKIIQFVVDVNDRELTICNVIKVTQHKYSNAVYNVIEFSDEVIIQTNTLSRNCVFIEIENQAFIVPVPNSLHY